MPQGSIFKFPIRFTQASYVLRVDETTRLGTDYYHASLGQADYRFPAIGTDLVPGDDYWMGGGAADHDLLQLFNGLGIGPMTLELTTNGLLARFTEATDVGGMTVGHYRLLWNHANTTLDPLLFGFTDNGSAAPQPTDSTGDADHHHVIANATRPPQGILRLEYPPTDDTLHGTPVIGGKTMACDGTIESSFYGLAAEPRTLLWDSLKVGVVITEEQDTSLTAISVQDFLTGPLAEGDEVRFYLNEADALDSFVAYNASAPFTQDYQRSRRPVSKLRWSWSVSLTRHA